MAEAGGRAEHLLGLMSSYQPSCVLGAGAELDVFGVLADHALTVEEAAAKCKADVRGMTALLNALAALDLLVKEGERFRLPPDLVPFLTESSPRNVVAMLRHQANCLRGWSELARIVRRGTPMTRKASIRGAKADRAAFIQAMDNISGPMAGPLVEGLSPLQFKHFLDVGGASGTWTVAFLRAVPDARATLFDLPDAIPHAQRRMKQNDMSERVEFVAGDFYADALPAGADFAWVSAIVHQNSRQQNRDLFAKVHAALVPGGRIVIRDVVMQSSKTEPRGGALFAINMLVHTPAGGTFTLAELDEDLQQAGFGPAKLLRSDPWMNSVVQAVKA